MQGQARYREELTEFEEQTKPFRTVNSQCFRCKGPDMLCDCKDLRWSKTNLWWDSAYCKILFTGKWTKGSHCAGNYPFIPTVVHHRSQPIIDILVEERRVKALVDTGCTTKLILSNLVDRWNEQSSIKAVDRREVRCRGTCSVALEIQS